MKETALKYGTISGIFMAVLLFISIPIAPKVGFESIGIVLFLGKIAACIPIFFGMRQYRQTAGGGLLTFWKGFNIGVFILVVSCFFYAIAWIILYYWVSPDFPNKYFQDYIVQLKLHGALPKDIADAQAQFQESQKVLTNPFINAAYAFTDPLQVGLILTLVFTFILRKAPPKVKIENLN